MSLPLSASGNLITCHASQRNKHNRRIGSRPTCPHEPHVIAAMFLPHRIAATLLDSARLWDENMLQQQVIEPLPYHQAARPVKDMRSWYRQAFRFLFPASHLAGANMADHQGRSQSGHALCLMLTRVGALPRGIARA